MFISNPGIVPIPLLHTIYDYSPVLFTMVMLFAHIALMGFGVYGIVKLVQYVKNRREKKKQIKTELLQEVENNKT